MNADSEKFSLDAVPEVFFTRAEWSRAIRSRVRAGELARLAPRLYTKNLRDSTEALVRRNLWSIVGGYFPGAVISDRTAIELRPTDDGSVFITHQGSDYRVAELPGLVIRARPGPGPLPGDTRYIAGLHISSEARALLENLRRSRSRSGPSRVLSREIVERRLAEIASRRGDVALNELRDAARELAAALSAESEFEKLARLIGALLGSRRDALRTAEGTAVRAGTPFDPGRVELLDMLVAEIRKHVVERRVERPAHMTAHFAFYEAYFSNYIEGTEFPVEEAKEIVFEGRIPGARPKDAHDVLGTFQLVGDPARGARVADSLGDYVEVLRDDHATLLSARPEVRPGEFKERPNQAAGFVFVAPNLVEGTLKEGYERAQALRPGFERAVLQLFLVAEVHPFADGNGRIARARMNAELSAAGEQRVMITTVHRDTYLSALRALSHNRNPTPLVRFVDHAQAFAAQGSWSDDEAAVRHLNSIDAFAETSGSGLGDALADLTSRQS